ncbi:MAG: tetratricopeptide repeat protein [Pirellulaceae bacterium]|nr:tetratricopeptide repeat protein [Pirellulaceae bacterium]
MKQVIGQRFFWNARWWKPARTGLSCSGGIVLPASPEDQERRCVVNTLLMLFFACCLCLVPSANSLGDVAQEEPQFWLEDAPAILKPLRPRSESDEDHSAAAARVAVGRIQFQQERLRESLQSFQRAFRLDANSVSVLSDIVPLQLALDRYDEAARYAVIGVQQQTTDIEIIRRLALYLTENLDFEGALVLYQKSIQLDLNADSHMNAASLVEMGRLYYLTQQFEDAAKVFDVVLPALRLPEKYGIDAKTHERILGRADLTYALIGETFLEIGRHDDAADLYRQAHETQNDESRLAVRLARVAAKSKDWPVALEQLQVYFTSKSTDEGSRPYELLQQVVANSDLPPDQWKQSLLQRLYVLRENDPDNRELAFFLADQLRSAGQLDEAMPIYQGLLDEGADIRGYIGITDILRQRQQVTELLKWFGQVALQLGSLEALGDQPAQIIQDEPFLNELIQAGLAADDEDGLRVGIRFACALLALHSEDFGQADKLFELAMADFGEQLAEMTLVWVMELFESGRYGRAADILQQAIDNGSVEAKNPYVFFLLAGAQELDGRTEQALGSAQKAVELQPDMPQWHSREAWILYHAGRHEEAYDKYAKLIAEFDDDHSSTQRRETLRDARFVLSNISVIREDFAVAEEWLEQVLDEFPADVGALNDLGYLYADQNKYLNRSLKMVQYASVTEPENVAYLDSVGWALHKLGRHNDALTYLVKASGSENPDGVILDHLGEVYWKLGQHDQAREVWRRAVAAFEQGENESLREKVSSKLDQRKSKE